jgi:hypothetical protein
MNALPERVLRQHQRVRRDLRHEPLPLRPPGKVHAPLEDAAAVAVGCHLHTMRRGRVENELVVIIAQPLETPLDHVVPIQVLDQGDDAGLEARDHEPHLVGPADGLDQLLDGAGAAERG